MKTVYIFTNIAPHYRQLLWRLLLENPRNDFHFFFGRKEASGIREIDFSINEFTPFRKKMHHVRNFWVKGNILVWQQGIISQSCHGKMDIAVFLGEMYCFSTWLAAIICRIRGIKVVFWGHGLYGNEKNLKLFLRKIFNRLADMHLLYECRAKEIMIKHGFNKDCLYVVFNSLNYYEHKILRQRYKNLNKYEVLSFYENPSLPMIIFIGRITQVKKLHLLIQAVNNINSEIPVLNLLIIGNGPEKKKLIKKGYKGLKGGWLKFMGECYDENQIGRYLTVADLCVSPGDVGLTAIHSLSFGTPVCTHSNFNNQMPEAGIIVEGYNGLFFKENDTSDLAEKIKKWIHNAPNRDLIRKNCFKLIDDYYNPDYQVKVFNQLVNLGKPQL